MRTEGKSTNQLDTNQLDTNQLEGLCYWELRREWQVSIIFSEGRGVEARWTLSLARTPAGFKKVEGTAADGLTISIYIKDAGISPDKGPSTPDLSPTGAEQSVPAHGSG